MSGWPKPDEEADWSEVVGATSPLDDPASPIHGDEGPHGPYGIEAVRRQAAELDAFAALGRAAIAFVTPFVTALLEWIAAVVDAIAEDMPKPRKRRERKRDRLAREARELQDRKAARRARRAAQRKDQGWTQD